MEVLSLWMKWSPNSTDPLPQHSNFIPAGLDSVSIYLPGHLLLFPSFHVSFFMVFFFPGVPCSSV